MTQITQFRNKREDINANVTEIKRFLKEHQELQFVNKIHNLIEMDKHSRKIEITETDS